jgi:hypothetical protein
MYGKVASSAWLIYTSMVPADPDAMNNVDPRDKRITDLEIENAALREQVKALRDELAAVKAELADLRRRQHRQTAPFSKDKKTADPKRPGRKPGQGPFTRRGEPKPEDVTQTVDAPVTQAHCPCGGELEAAGMETASTTEAPPTPKPDVTLFNVELKRCKKCGKVVRGTHPDLAPDQFGATAHRLGDRAKATAHALHYGFGVPVRKVPANDGPAPGPRGPSLSRRFSILTSAEAGGAANQVQETPGLPELGKPSKSRLP